MTRIDETQHRLVAWTNGQHSERLAAQVLLDCGFEEMDPSHPYGGKDGGRDAICTKDGVRYVMAVYFARGQQRFADIQSKFEADLASARKHSPDGVVFVTNQELRLAERGSLIALAEDLEIVIFHMEKIAAVLDQPHMHTIRQQYLDIATGPPPLDISLEISGVGGYFVYSHDLRDALIEMEADQIRKSAATSRDLSGYERERLRMMARTAGFPDPGDPMTPEQEEEAVSALRTRVCRNWGRSEQYLAVRALPGLQFTVANLAASFLHKVQVDISIHGAQAFDREFDNQHLLDRLVDPDYQPSRFAALPMPSLGRLANNPVSFDNVDGDVHVRINLDELRPDPVRWRSDEDEIIVIAPAETDSLTVSWHATASDYGTAYHGDQITLPVEPVDMREALGSVLDESD